MVDKSKSQLTTYLDVSDKWKLNNLSVVTENLHFIYQTISGEGHENTCLKSSSVTTFVIVYVGCLNSGFEISYMQNM